MAKKISAAIALDGEKQFRAAITAINKDMGVLTSEMKKSMSAFDANNKSILSLSKANAVLVKEIAKQEEKLKATNKGLENAQQYYKKAETNLNSWKSALSDAEKELERMKNTGNATEKELADQQKTVRELTISVEQATRSYTQIGNKTKDWMKSVNNAEADLNKLKTELSANTDLMDRMKRAGVEDANALKQVEDAAEQAKNKVSTLGDVFKGTFLATAAKDGIVAIGRALKEMGRDTLEAGTNFEAGMSKVQAISGATSTQMKELNSTAREEAATTKFTATEVADAYGYMGMAGWDATQMMAGLSPVLDLSAASGEDLAETSDIVTDALTAFGLQAEDAGHFTDVLAAAATSTNTTVGMMGDAFSQAAPLAGALGFSIEDVSLALGLMANSGIKAEKSGTALRNIFTALPNVVKITGQSIGEVAIQTQNADGTMRSLHDIITDMRSAFSGLSEAEKLQNAEAIGGKRAMAGLLAIVNSTDDQVNSLTNTLNKCDGATAQMAATMNDNLSGAWKILKSNMESLQLGVFDHFAEPLKKGLQSASKELGSLAEKTESGKLGRSLDKLGDAMGDLTEKAVKFAADALPGVIDGLTWMVNNGDKIISLLGGIGGGFLAFKAATLVESAVAAFQAFQVATEGATVAQTIFNGVLDANPLILLASGIGAVVSALAIYSATNTDVVNDFESSAMSAQRLSQECQDLSENIAASRESYQDTLIDLEAESTMSNKLADELTKLSEKTNKTTADKQRMASIVGQLKELVPGLSLEINNETGELNMSTEALKNNLKQFQKAAKAEAVFDRLKDAYKELTNIELKQSEAEAVFLDAKKKYEAEQERFFSHPANNTQGDIYRLDQARVGAENAGQEMAKLNGTYIDQQREIGILTGDYDDLASAQDSQAQATLNGTGAMQDASKGARDYAGTLSDAVDTIGEKLSQQMDQFKAFDPGEAMDPQTLIDNLNSQLKGVEDWAANFESLVGRGVDQGLLKKLADMGPEGASYVQAFCQMTDAQLQEYSANFAESFNVQDTVADQLAGMGDVVSSGLDAGVSAASEKGAETRDAYMASFSHIDVSTSPAFLQDFQQAGFLTAQQFNDSFARGIANMNNSANTATPMSAPQVIGAGMMDNVNSNQVGFSVGQGIANNVVVGIQGNQPQMVESGNNAGNDIVSGVESQNVNANTAGNQIANAVASGARSVGDMYSAGIYLVQGLVNGMESQRASVAEEAASLMRTAKTNAEMSALIHSPSKVWRDEIGVMLPKGLALGIADGQGEVNKAVSGLCGGALNTATTDLEIHSPSKKFNRVIGQQISRGVAFGIEARAGEAIKSSKKLSMDVYVAASNWVGQYKKTHAVAIDDEVAFWRQVAGTVKKGTSAYHAAMTNANSLASWKSTMTKQAKSGFGVSWWNGDDVKDAESYYSEVLNAGKKYYENCKILYDYNSQQDLTYWTALRTTLHKGTQAWYDATKEIKDIKARIKQEVAQGYADLLSDSEDWLRKYKINHDVSIKYEISYWKNIKKQMIKGSDEWYNITEKIKGLQEDYYSQMLADQEDYIEKAEIRNGENAHRDLEYWKSKLKNYKKYSEEWYSVTKNIQEAQERLYDNAVSTAETFLKRKKLHNGMSLQEELDYWKAIQKQLKDGSDQWWQVEETIVDLKENIADAGSEIADKTSNVQDKILSSWKTYFNVSEQAEASYWDICRKQFQAGTDERIAADEKYYSAHEQYNNDLQQLNDDYVQNCEDVNNDLKDSIQGVIDSYEDEVKSRKESIYSAFSLFDKFSSESVSGKELLFNLETQVAGYADWEQQLDVLSKRGISKDLLQELSDMGPESAASLHALNQLTDSQLSKYEELWQQKVALSTSQAYKDSEASRQQMNDEITKLRADAKDQLVKLTDDYNVATAKLSEGISASLASMAFNSRNIGEDTVASLIAGIKSETNTRDTNAKLNAAKNTITTNLNTLPASGKVIGGSMLQGIIDGLCSPENINNGANKFISALKKAIKKKADINSPSKVFRNEVGYFLGTGVAEGITDAIPTVNESMTAMLDNATAQVGQAQKAARIAQGALTDVNTNTNVNTTYKVDNSDAISVMQQMFAIMSQYLPQCANQEVVLDSGKLVGGTQNKMSAALAALARRTR